MAGRKEEVPKAEGTGATPKFVPKIPARRSKKQPDAPTSSAATDAAGPELGGRGARGSRRGGGGASTAFPQRKTGPAVLTASGPFAFGPAQGKSSSGPSGGSGMNSRSGGGASGGAGTGSSTDQRISNDLVFLNSGSLDAIPASSDSEQGEGEEDALGSEDEDYQEHGTRPAHRQERDTNVPVIVEEEFKQVRRAEARARREQLKSITEDHKPLSHVIFAEPCSMKETPALMLFQIPDVPSLLTPAPSPSSSLPSAPTPTTTPGGKVGRLIMYKSGKMRLKLNDGLSFDVRQGTHFSDVQKVISIAHPSADTVMGGGGEEEEEGQGADASSEAREPPQAYILGNLTKKFIVSPDIDTWC